MKDHLFAEHINTKSSAELRQEINALQKELDTMRRRSDELTSELLRLFIERIKIGERAKKYSHSAAQDIRIVYRDIGMVDSNMEKGEQSVHMATLPRVSMKL